jgi:hypothetical protein
MAGNPEAAQPPTPQTRQKLDRRLRQRLTAMPPAAIVKAIVTARPGSKAALREALVAAGATITAEYSIIEALGVEISASALRTIAEDARVVAVSTDADVDPGSATTSAADTRAPHTNVRAPHGDN